MEKQSNNQHNQIDISSFLEGTPQLYSSLFTAKNGSVIPVFASNRTMESRYNPQSEAERLVEVTPSSSFYIVLGIGGGILIEKLLQKYPSSFFLCIEKDDETLTFLHQLPLITELENNPHVKLTTIQNLSSDFEATYIPSLYGGLYVVEQKGWVQEVEYLYPLIQRIIKASLNNISADFSVQTHFGKMWQKNILNNLKTYSFITSNAFNLLEAKLKSSKQKKAAIIAAGPSLDKTISILSNSRYKYFIISTDTAYTSLLRNNLIPDAVVSIDGQNVSHSHFFNNNPDLSSTLFVFDLCANHSAVNHIANYTANILFSASGHPFSELICSYAPQTFIHLFSGSGTVTISALDFAVKCGFSSIEVFGADFSYYKTRTYTKGTYLDDLFSVNSSALKTFEYNFLKLLFRTELIQSDDDERTSTTVLDSYRQSFEQYLQSNNYSFNKTNNRYFITLNNSQNIFSQASAYSPLTKSDFIEIIKRLQNQLKINENELKNSSETQKNTIFELNNLDISLLPLISSLRFYDNKNSSFQVYLKKAYQLLSRNLSQYEK